VKRTPLKRDKPMRRVTPLRTTTVGLRRVAHSTKPPTAEDEERFQAMRQIGCVACLKNQEVGRASATLVLRRLEIHHLISGGRRIGHHATICLCHFHHQAKFLPYVDYGYQAQAAAFGPSLEREPRRFHDMYGTDEELLARQNALLAHMRTTTPENAPA
jgi:hypothetical protein